MVVTTYYGVQQGTTRLSLYTEPNDGSQPVTTHRSLKDQEAYDTWHLAYYFKDILECEALREAGDTTFESVPRKEKFLLAYLMLCAEPRIQRVTELGCSLFEMIDGLELVNEIAKAREGTLPSLDLSSYSYVGVEIADILGLASRTLHRGYNVEIYKKPDETPEDLGFLYDRNVTAYVFESAAELADFMNRATVGFVNLFVSLEDTFQSSRLGKQITYFSLSELLPLLDRPLFHLFGDRAPGPESGQDISLGRPVVEGFFLNCDEAYLDHVVSLANGVAPIREYFSGKGINPRAAEVLIS